MYFATSSQCRSQQILRYFGDASATRCNHCDNCRRRPRADDAPHREHEVDESLLQVVRIVLSGVARIQVQLNVGCGKNLIAQMLCGSRSARMSKLGLDGLSTFGLLAHLTQPEVVDLIDALITTRYLEQVDIERHRPVVQLTDLGAEVMKGMAELETVPPIPAELLAKIRGGPPSGTIEGRDQAPGPADAVSEPDRTAPVDPDLVAALKQWRGQVASAAKIPPHYVLSNATLEEIARSRPSSSDALMAVKGIGPAKLERYGEALLALVERHGVDGDSPERDAVADAPLPPAPTAATAAAEAPEEALDTPPGDREEHPSVEGVLPRVSVKERPSHYWTWRLLCSGFSPEECEAIRGVSRDEVLDHLLRALDEGLTVEAERCLAPGLLAALEREFSAEQGPPMRSLLDRLPAGTRHAEVQLFLKCRGQASHG
jgi:ATP-dependent DNA helicase RecQ